MDSYWLVVDDASVREWVASRDTAALAISNLQEWVSGAVVQMVRPYPAAPDAGKRRAN
jgi:hypothetical protein